MTKYLSALSEGLKLYIQKYTDISFEQEQMLSFSSKTGKISFEKYFSKNTILNNQETVEARQNAARSKSIITTSLFFRLSNLLSFF